MLKNIAANYLIENSLARETIKIWENFYINALWGKFLKSVAEIPYGPDFKGIEI